MNTTNKVICNVYNVTSATVANATGASKVTPNKENNSTRQCSNLSLQDTLVAILIIGFFVSMVLILSMSNNVSVLSRASRDMLDRCTKSTEATAVNITEEPYQYVGAGNIIRDGAWTKVEYAVTIGDKTYTFERKYSKHVTYPLTIGFRYNPINTEEMFYDRVDIIDPNSPMHDWVQYTPASEN